VYLFQIKINSNVLMQKGQLATNNANIKTASIKALKQFLKPNKTEHIISTKIYKMFSV